MCNSDLTLCTMNTNEVGSTGLKEARGRWAQIIAAARPGVNNAGTPYHVPEKAPGARTRRPMSRRKTFPGQSTWATAA